MRALQATTVALLLLQAGPATPGPCILPVQGEEPFGEQEADELFRLGWDTPTLPGYEGLVFQRQSLPYTASVYGIVGQTARRIAPPAPGSSVFDTESLPVLGGGQILLGWDERSSGICQRALETGKTSLQAKAGGATPMTQALAIFTWPWARLPRL